MHNTSRGEHDGSAVASDGALSKLRCLTCRDRLQQRDSAWVWVAWNRHFPWLNRVYHFVDAQQYSGSFGLQRRLHAKNQLDGAESNRSERASRRRTVFRSEDLAGRPVLDVGYAMGSKHTYEEVFRWYEACGLEDLRVIEQRIAARGCRLAPVETSESHLEMEISQCAG